MTLLLAACGSPVATTADRPSGTTPQASPAVEGTATPVATAAPTPTPAPALPALVAVTSTNAAGAMTIRLVGLDGTTVASTTIPNSSSTISGWVKSGPDGAYWLSGNVLRRLGRDGRVTDVTPMPDGAYFAVGPGDEIAYSLTSPVNPTTSWTNELYTVIPGGAPQLLAERSGKGTLDGAPAAPGIPQYDWLYDPLGWTRSGLLIARLPQGGCGCGAFGMDSVQTDTGIVDPVSGIAGSVTQDTSCPVSNVAASDGTEACFHNPTVRTSKNEGLGANELRILNGGSVTQTFSLSTQNAGGDATFSADATQLAYATAPADGVCGSWEGQTTLRVLNLVTGSAQPLGPLGLQPVAWLPGGRLLADQTTGSPSPGFTTTAMVVDPATGAVQQLAGTASTSTTVVGVVTG